MPKTNPMLKLVKDSDNEIVIRVTTRFSDDQIISASSCTLALEDQSGTSAGAPLAGTYDPLATLSSYDEDLGAWVFAVTPAYLDSEGLYRATFTIVQGGRTRVDKFYCDVADRV